MKTSAIRRGGLEILQTIYAPVLKSTDKSLWKRALDSIHQRIHNLECRKVEQTMTGSGDIDHTIRDLWFWNSARRQFMGKFGKKFITPHLQKS
jgi:hypothetical protein